MLHIEEVSLDVVLPEDGIGMVMMQPYIDLIEDTEPYRWRDKKKGKQMEQIAQTLRIAEQAEHGCERTHFTVFPEYTIPGLEGIGEIEQILKHGSWEKGTVVIGGIDGLPQSDYLELCNSDITCVHDSNNADRVRDNKWVNCSIIWVRQKDGILKRWIQPKMVPAWPEKNIADKQMFLGSSVYVFKCGLQNKMICRFMVLLCFDWIGRIDSDYGIQAVLSALNDHQWNPDGEAAVIDFVFLLQYNAAPNHRSFLENARDYFSDRAKFPFVARDNSTIVCANAAGGAHPGKYQTHGYSALLFSPNAPYINRACPPSFSVMPEMLRNTDSLGRCKQALFREMGACVHSFGFRSPRFIDVDTRGKCLPIDEVLVHAIDQAGQLSQDQEIEKQAPEREYQDDPRTPGRPVPASIKWINDQLDNIVLLPNYRTHPLRHHISRAHGKLSDQLRKQAGHFVCKYIEISSCEISDQKNKWIGNSHNIDNWDQSEIDNLWTILHSLSIVKSCKPLRLGDLLDGSFSHGLTVHKNGCSICVIVVCGKEHQDCFEYAKGKFTGNGFAIVVTRNASNSVWHDRFDSILKEREKHPERGPSITDPDSRFHRCGFPNLVSSYSGSENIEQLGSKLKELIGIDF